MTQRKHSKYDIELWAGEEFVGYMLDRSADAADVAIAEQDQQASIALSSSSPAGDYNWKDQRTMPGVAISDFRAGQGQRVLDRNDSASNAFRDGRFLNCEKEGEISLAPSLLTAICDDLEETIIEAGGYIWGSFIPTIDDPPDDDQPMTVRYLERYELTLTNELHEGHYAAFDEDVTDVYDDGEVAVQVGDWFYDPDNREIMQVTDLADTPNVTLDFNAGYFDNDAENHTTKSHPAGQVLQCYGWRSVDFDFAELASPDDHPPREHCRALAFDGQYLYAALADTSGGGAIWRLALTYGAGGHLDVTAGFERMIEVGGVSDLAFGMGRLYYAAQGASETIAGYIGYDTAGTALEANQLTFDAVVGEVWTDTTHFEKDERKLFSPLVYSKGLKMNATWCYWLTQSGRNSWLYRMQAPAGFELVKPFSKGFIATCLESAWDNVFVGGYHRHADGTTEGVVYIVQGDTAERVVTLEDPSMDNTIKGLTAVGQLIYIVTNTQVFIYSVKTAGWWHAMDLPPANPSTSIVEVDTDLWSDFELPDDPGTGDELEPHLAHPTEFTRVSESSTPPNKAESEFGTVRATMWVQNNLRYSRYRAVDTLTGADGALLIRFPNTAVPSGAVPIDGYQAPYKRRALEMRIQNGSREGRMRIYGRREGQYWRGAAAIGTYNQSTHRWSYQTEKAFPYLAHEDLRMAMQLAINADGVTGTFIGNEIASFTWFVVPNERLQAVATSNVEFWCGIPAMSDTSIKTSDYGWLLETDSRVDFSTSQFRVDIDNIHTIQENMTPFSTAILPEGTGQVAELDGEVFIPIAGNDTYDGQLAFTRYGETYAGREAFIETSDSYQGMGTAQKYYRRMELAYPALLEGQELTGEAIIDDAVASESPDLESTYEDGTSRSSALTMKAINKGGIKSRVKVGLIDNEHLRPVEERLRLNSIGVRFLPNSSALKHVYTVACIDNIECRDGTHWDTDAHDAIEFIKRLKNSGEVFKVTDDGGEYEAVVDTYQISYDPKDEHGIGPRQGTVQFTVKVIDE